MSFDARPLGPNTGYAFSPLPREISRQNKTIDDALGTQTDEKDPDTGEIRNKGTVLEQMVPDHQDPTSYNPYDPEAIAAPEQGTIGTQVDVTIGEEEQP